MVSNKIKTTKEIIYTGRECAILGTLSFIFGLIVGFIIRAVI
jgi:hypothetical protein